MFNKEEKEIELSPDNFYDFTWYTWKYLFSIL